MVRPTENNGSIRIRLTVQGRLFNIALPGLHWDVPTDRAAAEITAAMVRADLLNGTFDASLKRYQQQGGVRGAITGQLSELELWDSWVLSRGLNPYTLAGHYKTTRRAIERGDLFRAGLSPFTHNLRLRLMRQVYEQAAEANPYDRIQPKRGRAKPIYVFTRAELVSILTSVSQLYGGHYTLFTRALMVSGCRLGEVSGIVARNVNTEAGEVTISTSVRRNISTNRSELRQGTKTETSRVLKSSQLISILVEQGIPDDANEPVFRSHTGKLIDRSRYRASVWKPALAAAGVSYRNIHTLRHRCLSMALAAGVSVPDVAYLAGHTDSTMVVRTYGHMLNRPDLPEMDLGR